MRVARLDRRGLWKRPLGGGHETLIAEQIRADQWPNWGLYDRGIFYVTWPDEGDPQLAVIDAGGPAAPRLLARLPEYSWSGIAVSRDGSRIVYAHGDRRAGSRKPAGSNKVQRLLVVNGFGLAHCSGERGQPRFFR